MSHRHVELIDSLRVELPYWYTYMLQEDERLLRQLAAKVKAAVKTAEPTVAKASGLFNCQD